MNQYFSFYSISEAILRNIKKFPKGKKELKRFAVDLDLESDQISVVELLKALYEKLRKWILQYQQQPKQMLNNPTVAEYPFLRRIVKRFLMILRAAKKRETKMTDFVVDVDQIEQFNKPVLHYWRQEQSMRFPELKLKVKNVRQKQKNLRKLIKKSFKTKQVSTNNYKRIISQSIIKQFSSLDKIILQSNGFHSSKTTEVPEVITIEDFETTIEDFETTIEDFEITIEDLEIIIMFDE